MARDYGYNIGLQATAVGLGIGAVLATGHARAIEAVQRKRQERVDAAHAANLDLERANHVELAALARDLARRLAASEAENARLTRALAQRQAFIDRQRRSAA